MNQVSRKIVLVLAGAALICGFQMRAQAQDAPPTLDPSKKQQPQQPADQAKPDVTPLTLDSTPPPVNAEEDAAIKAFRDVPATDIPKKIQAGEGFLQKYPESRYRGEVYIWLVRAYLVQGQIDKMEAMGDKEIALNPDDPQTLAILGSTLPRAMNASTPNPSARLDKAEQYCRKSLDLLPTLPKPADLTDEDFAKAKDQTSAMAYGGLGIIAVRRQKFAEAIPNFEQAIKLDTTPDAVNYYLLGISSQKTSHFDDAVAAYTKCAAIASGLQATCKSSIDEAKKLGATQLNAPK
jgi:tetratricopeptide (TPR) repeat protein